MYKQQITDLQTELTTNEEQLVQLKDVIQKQQTELRALKQKKQEYDIQSKTDTLKQAVFFDSCIGEE